MQALFREAPDSFSHALGDAVVKIWGHLPQGVQHDLFEEALTSEWKGMRTELAVFLHGKHPRTAAATVARAIIEPDSLGG